MGEGGKQGGGGMVHFRVHCHLQGSRGLSRARTHEIVDDIDNHPGYPARMHPGYTKENS